MSTSQRQRSVSYIRLNGLYSYFPTQEDLAVHKRKVNDVRQWLLEAFQPSKLQKYRVGLFSSIVHYYRLLTSCFLRLTQRLLVLTGPAGSGKTTTLRVLSRELGFEILEWRNPLSVAAAPSGRRARFGELFDLCGGHVYDVREVRLRSLCVHIWAMPKSLDVHPIGCIIVNVSRCWSMIVSHSHRHSRAHIHI